MHKRLIRFVLPCMFLSLPAAHARPVAFFSLEDLAKRAEVLAVGEILSVETVESVPREQSKWETALIRVKIRVKVLRSYSPKGAAGLREGEMIAVRAIQVDPTKPIALINGPFLPDLTPGRILVLPLRATGGAGIWELIEEEDLNLVIPAVREPLTTEPVTDALSFLERELAGAFIRGDYATIGRAARFLNSSPTSKNGRANLTLRIRGIVQRAVRRDEKRWVTIAAASYGAMSTARPTIAALLDWPPEDGTAAVVAAALGRIERSGLDEKLISESIKDMSVDPWGTAFTLISNYSTHPVMLRLMDEALRNDAPGALYVAQYIIKAKDHPLTSHAVRAAVRALSTRDKSADLRSACPLIRDYGDDVAFAALIDAFRQAQKADRARYQNLWSSSAYTTSRRVIPICRLAIEDDALSLSGLSYARLAACALQHITGLQFCPPDAEADPATRQQGIERAKAWLATQPH